MNKVKVLLLMPRKKDNSNIDTNELQHRKVFKKIWSTLEEREKRLTELKAVASCYPEYKWRIYETINWRDLRKTYYEFQKKMLDWQRTDATGQMDWLDKVHSEWTSTMMRPQCRYKGEGKDNKDDTSFLIDVDNKDKEIIRLVEVLLSDIVVKEKYETPGGWHYIVEPFNIIGYNFYPYDAEIHTDGLRLVEVIK